MNTFTEMISKSYDFNELEYYSSKAWRTVRELYILNQKKDEQKIPRKIHQIWLGSAFPDRYKSKFHPTWEYKLWTDTDINSLEIRSRKVFDSAKSPAMRSDMLRYEILLQQGGLYVDTDFECLQPFDDLMYLDLFTGISYDGVLQLYNGLIASIPNHPIIEDCTKINSVYTGFTGSKIIESTGAYHFTRCFLRNATSRTIAFPMDYFYPYPNNMRGRGDPYSYITENSYAIHHWAVSWSKANKR
jgi:mannosyltransferase OCH1-like enzyme